MKAITLQTMSSYEFTDDLSAMSGNENVYYSTKVFTLLKLLSRSVLWLIVLMNLMELLLKT